MMATPTKARDNVFARARRCGYRDASGYLALDNVKDVHDLLRAFLFDGSEPRRFTWVDAYEYAGFRPRVRTGLRAEEVSFSVDELGCAIHVLDTDHSWGLHSRFRTQAEAREEGDPLAVGCWIRCEARQLEVKLLTPEGKNAWWCVALEENL